MIIGLYHDVWPFIGRPEEYNHRCGVVIGMVGHFTRDQGAVFNEDAGVWGYLTSNPPSEGPLP